MTMQEAYDLLDRYLRNNLDNTDYEQYSSALMRLMEPNPPLSDFELSDLYSRWEQTPGASYSDLVRSVEAAHGITGETK